MHLFFFTYFISRLKVRNAFTFPFMRRLSGETKMRILNVAEKNDVAKNIANLLSKGTATRREGVSVLNKIYEFECEVFNNHNSRMIMTSVSGHLFQLDYISQYNHWNNINPISLFEAPIKNTVKSNFIPIRETLEREIRNCSKLIIWTDCDREGENIGFEIISVCKGVKKNIEVYRAKFSEITLHSVKKALINLEAPNVHLNNAVEVRKELDFRIGTAFTRFQTLYLQKAFPEALKKNLISYGSCQFPTLGFVVERFKAISEFTPEPFWAINVQHTISKLIVDFHWKRTKLFNKLACEVLFNKCAESGVAKVENIESKPRIKWRPKPLDTVTLQKLASKKFGLSAKETLEIAEKLYGRGLISYPRTETTFFSKDINLVQLVQCQTNDAQWGEFAQKILREGPNPFQGNKSDQAHPPIHPIKYSNELRGKEQKIYEFIVRHFLACLSKHAEGLETVVDIDIAGEKFSAKGFMLTAKNYLEVYPYEVWSDKQIHTYQKGEIFRPEILMNEGETSPPSLLTEADLIGLMEKHNIGTDATHAEHIETIKARLYVGLQDDKYFVPRTLGMGLVEGYNNMGYGMAKPELRAELEADLKRICEGRKSSAEVLAKFLEKYKKIYEDVERQTVHLIEAIQSYIEVDPIPIEPGCFFKDVFESVGKCPTCQSDLVLKRKKNGEKFIGCSASPECRTVLWLPSFVLDVSKTSDTCPVCGPNTYLLRFKFKKGSCFFPQIYVGCIGGCDQDLLKVLNFDSSSSKINTTSSKTRSEEGTSPSTLREINDSGFVSLNENSPPRISASNLSPECYCGVPALLTSKKSGPYPRREYYKCGTPGNFPKCNFFQWKNVDKSKNINTNRISDGVDDEEGIRCYCSMPCRRLTTMKEGPNKGRAFFACGKSFRSPDKCQFFKWVDCEESSNAYKDTNKIDHRTAAGRDGKAWDSTKSIHNKRQKMWTLWSFRTVHVWWEHYHVFFEFSNKIFCPSGRDFQGSKGFVAFERDSSASFKKQNHNEPFQINSLIKKKI